METNESNSPFEDYSDTKKKESLYKDKLFTSNFVIIYLCFYCLDAPAMVEEPKTKDAAKRQKKMKFPSMQMTYNTEDSKQDKERVRHR